VCCSLPTLCARTGCGARWRTREASSQRRTSTSVRASIPAASLARTALLLMPMAVPLMPMPMAITTAADSRTQILSGVQRGKLCTGARICLVKASPAIKALLLIPRSCLSCHRQWCLCQWQRQPQQLLYLNYSEDAFRGDTSAGSEVPVQGREPQEHAPQQKPG